jgi:hypothetical protein
VKHPIVYIMLIVVILTSILIPGCSEKNDTYYYVLVVRGKEQIIDKFDPYARVEEPIIKIDYYMHQKVAQDEHSDLKIEETPIVYIFTVEKNKKKTLILKTTEIDKALKYLRTIRKDYKE